LTVPDNPSGIVSRNGGHVVQRWLQAPLLGLPAIPDSARGNALTTIREVAEQAGVSISTVSRVLSDHPDVSPATRDRVQAVVDRLQYQPSAFARGLKVGYARILGLMVSDVTNPFYPELVQVIESTAVQRGYTILLSATEDDPDLTAASLRVLREYHADGIVHASARTDDPILTTLGDPAAAPVVFVNRTVESAQASSVTVDNFEGAVMATRHLLDLGRRTLVHLAGPPWASNALARQAGFRAATDAAGIGDRARVVPVGFFIEEARGQIREAMRQGPRPDAVFAVNDSIAIAAMEELVDLGLRIPEDVAVIGFDDTHLSASRFIRLSTVAHNVAEMASVATTMLIDRIEGRLEAWPRRIVLPPRLVVRASTAGPGEQG
jgi:LacI family transcriptional regulator